MSPRGSPVVPVQDGNCRSHSHASTHTHTHNTLDLKKVARRAVGQTGLKLGELL